MTNPIRSSTRRQRIQALLSHIPSFLFRFLRLLSFVIVLSPAFVVFVWHYFMCDRVAVYYGECCCETKDEPSVANGNASNGTGDYTNGKVNGYLKCATIANDTNCQRCKICRPFFSRHYLDIYGSQTNNNSTTTNSPQKKKPVLLFLTGGAYIIGYKMWGTLLARALASTNNILVIVPDYRNYPRVTIQGMVEDVDLSLEWVLNHVHEYGGDRDKVVVVGQSAGGHLGGICLVRRVLERIRRWRIKCQSVSSATVDSVMGSIKEDSNTSYEATDICGFISTSSPQNMVTMKHIFHKHGLSKSVQRSIFGGINNDLDVNGENVFEKWSTFHLVKKCQEEYVALMEDEMAKVSNASELSGFNSLKDLFPKMCIIHGTNDKTVSIHNYLNHLLHFHHFVNHILNNKSATTSFQSKSGTNRRINIIPIPPILPPNSHSAKILPGMDSH